MRAEIDKRAMTGLAAGHLATDFANGALPALLPFLVHRFELSYTLAATLMLASAVSSSVVQPLFGLWSDRRGAIWLLPGGVAVAAFHPEGSKFAAYVSGRRRASGMSAFSIGGNVGFALGPIVATPLVVWFGLRGGWLLAVPCLAIAVALLVLTPYLQSFVPPSETAREAAGADRLGALALLLGVIAFRSFAW